MVGRRPLRWMLIGWSVLLVVFVWLALVAWWEPGGAWWVPVTFGACALVCAGNLATWIAQARRR